MSQSRSLLICLLLICLSSLIEAKLNNEKLHSQNLVIDDITGSPSNANCLTYLPYRIFDNPEVDYYNWYGLLGKDIRGTTYQNGHAFERHIAVNGACTLEQKQENKTVFLNLIEFQKAASKLVAVCDIPNHTTFTYDYDGKIASPTDYIAGIDCRTGAKQTFNAYFVEFKRAIKNAHPTHDEYVNSNYVTVWTFYPKRA